MKQLLFILITINVFASQAQMVTMKIDEPVTCADIKAQPMKFLTDGSFQSEAVVRDEVEKLKVCGLDDYDVRFFGRIEILSTLLKKMTASKTIASLTYGDFLTAIEDMSKTPSYQDVKEITQLSQKLAETKANIRTWDRDEQLFDKLGASQAVKDKVYKYLRENPLNELTYQELLVKLKK